MAKKTGTVVEFETKKWLMEDLGFTDAEATELLPRFEPRKDKVQSGFLRQADYSRHMAEVQALQAELATKNDQLNAEMAQWAEAQATDATRADQLRKDLETTQQEKLVLEQRLKTVAEQAGLDLTTVLPKKEITPPVDKKTPVLPEGFDPTKVVMADQIGPILAAVWKSPFDIAAIQHEHLAITGQPLTGDEIQTIAQTIQTKLEKKQPVTLRQVWEETFDIPAKRQAKATADHDAELKAAEDRGYERARSEAAIPGQQAPGHVAPIFQRPVGADGASKLQRPQPGQDVRRYAESLRSRKYRPSVAGSTGGTR